MENFQQGKVFEPEASLDEEAEVLSGPSFPQIDSEPSFSRVVSMRLPRPAERADFDRRPYPGMQPSYSDNGGHRERTKWHQAHRRQAAQDVRRRMNRTPDSGKQRGRVF